MKTRSFFATSFLGMALAAAAFAASPKSAHWKSRIELAGGPAGDRTIQSESWLKGESMRTTSSTAGMKMVMVKSGDFFYQWQEGQKTGMKFSTKGDGGEQRGSRGDYVRNLEKFRAKGKKTGTETVESHVCDVYELVSSGARGEKKETIWIARDVEFPIRYVVESAGTKMTTVNSDIKLDVPVDDSMLKPPSDVQFQDATEMLKGMRPKAP